MRSPKRSTLLTVSRHPAYFAPDEHPERVLPRRNAILRRMLDQRQISTETYEQSIAEPLRVAKRG